ncbi:recombinase family protein [Clostridium sp. KNHs205]|uniref:recombinase family protein n=1 Tax=Clostridium sp. KNHs205 TaxID=1449050 RepID=UPI00051BA325|nr:recombinase family protein [Clostridium sp. KNHs205]
MQNYVMYLRKSRADVEAESHGEGETLLRHEKMLLELSKKMKLNITKIYREIVSGDSIASRPDMQKLLSEVESGIWAGVLVVEVERLARGDTIDQGIVAQAFKVSNTKIITPLKTYDPNNEFDEEYFEFGLFMSRREYKTINRRLQGGRVAAAKEGKFVGSRPAYGYKIAKILGDKGNTLEVIPEQANIVKLIFSLYTEGIIDEFDEKRRLGIEQIARTLNEMHIPPSRKDYWVKSTIRDILINPVYAGKIRWNWRANQKQIINGEPVVSRPRNEEYVLVNGLHEAIVSEEVFARAQEFIAMAPPAPVGYKNQIKNPFAGIIVCGICGRKTVLRKGSTVGNHRKKDYIVCHARGCKNVGSAFNYIEDKILGTIKSWYDRYTVELDQQKIEPDINRTVIEKSLKSINEEIATLNKQQINIFDLLEQGVYSTEQFLERSQNLSERINSANESKISIESKLSRYIEMETASNQLMPKIRHLLDVYESLPSAAQKNELLKEIVEKIEYTKDKAGSPEDFQIVMYPKLPVKIN